MKLKRYWWLLVIAVLAAAVVFYYAVPRTLDTQGFQVVSCDTADGVKNLNTDAERACLTVLNGCTYRPRFPLFVDHESFSKDNALILTLERPNGSDAEVIQVYLFDTNHTSYADLASGTQYTISDGAKLKAALLEILE